MHSKKSEYGAVKIWGPLFNPTSSSACIIIGEEYKNDVLALKGGYDGGTKINGDFKEAGESGTSDTFTSGGDTNDTVDMWCCTAHTDIIPGRLYLRWCIWSQ